MLSVEYVAGFFDADGCVTISKIKRSPQAYPIAFRFDNGSYNVLKLMQYMLELCEIKMHLRRKKVSGNSAPAWRLETNKSSEVTKICLLLQPHLVVKQKEVELTLEFLRYRKVAKDTKMRNAFKDEKFALYKRIKELKHERYI